MNGAPRSDGWPADEPVRIVEYDTRWPDRFEAERGLLHDAIGPWVAGGIHHVGSTAVPGLAAKPVIDILVEVAGLPSSRACFEPLARLDYLYAPYRTEEMHWFCKPHPSRRTHHLHLVPVGSARARDELAFRTFCARTQRRPSSSGPPSGGRPEREAELRASSKDHQALGAS